MYSLYHRKVCVLWYFTPVYVFRIVCNAHFVGKNSCSSHTGSLVTMRVHTAANEASSWDTRLTNQIFLADATWCFRIRFDIVVVHGFFCKHDMQKTGNSSHEFWAVFGQNRVVLTFSKVLLKKTVLETSQEVSHLFFFSIFSSACFSLGAAGSGRLILPLRRSKLQFQPKQTVRRLD